jgi:hypothetical protein
MTQLIGFSSLASNPAVPNLGAAGGALGTMHQGPMPPWRSEDEKEEYKRDPRQFLLDRCGLWSNRVRVLHNWVITTTYYLPDHFDVAGGGKLFLPEKTHDEALWQGKVGLVIAKGPLAFKDDDVVKFDGQMVEIGEWVVYDIMEGRQLTIDRMHCRRMKDTQLVMVIPEPEFVY